MPGDVEADHARRLLGDLDVVLVRLPRPIDRDAPRSTCCPVAASSTVSPFGGTSSIAKPCFLTSSIGGLVDLDAREHLLVADPAPRVLVRRVSTSSATVCLPSPITCAGTRSRDRDHPAADHEHAVVAARRRSSPPPPGRRRDSFTARLNPVRTARSVRRSSPTPRPWFPSSGFVTTGNPIRFAAATASSSVRTTSLLGTGRPGRAEQLVRHLLVARDVHGERARLGGHRGADPLLVLPLSELHERLLVQADERDVAARGLVEDGLGRRAELPPLGQQDQPLELRGEIELRLGFTRWLTEPYREPPGLTPTCSSA